MARRCDVVNTTVVLSTYRQPEWLRKSLWGYAEQTRTDFEVVVADDGSGPATARVIEEMGQECPFPIVHVRHEDRGWRKCLILNRAVAESTGEYLIFSDGDLIPRDDFVDVHVRLSERGRFLSGGAVRLSMDVSRAIDREAVRSGRFADATWIRSRGQRLGRHRLRLLRGAPSGWLDRLTPTRPTWNGGNASVHREAVYRVNGFESSLGHGGEDREFGQRLESLGLAGKQIRYRAVLLHLEHPRPYASTRERSKNRRLRKRRRRTGTVRARNGLAQMTDERESMVSGDPPESSGGGNRP